MNNKIANKNKAVNRIEKIKPDVREKFRIKIIKNQIK